MTGPDPARDRPARTKLRRTVRTIIRKLRPVAIVLQLVYYAFRVARELLD